VKKRFQTTYGSRAQTALPYAMNSEFSSVLAAQLVRFLSGRGDLIYVIFILFIIILFIFYFSSLQPSNIVNPGALTWRM